MSVSQAQCVLDLDLDFFLSDCCPMADLGKRPAREACSPWPEEAVRAFLEQNCGLSRMRPIPGRIFPTHDLALDFWREHLLQGTLRAPFHVTHVDAHSDLGIAPPRATYVEASVLCQAPAARDTLSRYRREGQLTEANYLLFAMAFRWICHLDNVRNPRSRADIPEELLAQNSSAEHMSLLLRQPFPQLFSALHGPEPEIPFAVYHDYREFRCSAPFSLVSLAMSPRYVPKEADSLAEIISEYMCL